MYLQNIVRGWSCEKKLQMSVFLLHRPVESKKKKKKFVFHFKFLNRHFIKWDPFRSFLAWKIYKICHVFMVLEELQKSVFQDGKEGKVNDLLEYLLELWEQVNRIYINQSKQLSYKNYGHLDHFTHLKSCPYLWGFY